jgi:hypothetical protein
MVAPDEPLARASCRSRSIPRVHSVPCYRSGGRSLNAGCYRRSTVASRERGLTVAARREYLQVMRERYARAVGRAAKGALLDEIERVLGWHRKHAIRAMAAAPPTVPRVRRGRPRRYLACLSAIERVWEALDYCCAERLQPHLVRVAADLVRCGELEAPAEVLEELGRISRATVARRIAELPRPKPRRLPVAPHPQRLLKTAVPIGRFAWDEVRPGALEVDLVEHNGGSSSGHYAATLSVVDVVSGWSRRRAVLGKSQAVVHEALEWLLSEWPTRVWGLHSDNGAEFLNNHLVRYCRRPPSSTTAVVPTARTTTRTWSRRTGNWCARSSAKPATTSPAR